MNLQDFFFAPFEYLFLKRALIGCLALSVGCGPIGVLLILRRMSLMGDALSHAVLPGAAIGFLGCGLSLPAISIGGFIAGLVVALLAGIISRKTILEEDATFAGFFLISLALGILILSSGRNSIDLMHLLFGSALAVDQDALILVGTISSITLITLALIYRPLIFECFDRQFFASLGAKGSIYHVCFLVLVVLNLISGFQALGTLMALGMMILPALAARFWARRVYSLSIIAAFLGALSSYIGLLCSYHKNLPSGPAIILIAGIFYLTSLIFGRYGSLRKYSKGKK